MVHVIEQQQLSDLAAQLAHGAQALSAVHELLAAARAGTVVPASSARVLLEPAVDAVGQAMALLQALQATAGPTLASMART